MFYKKDNENWNVATKLVFPTKPISTEVTSDNYSNFESELEFYGWFWSDDEPEEYKEWVEEQEKD